MKGTEVIFNGTGSLDNIGIVNWTWESTFDGFKVSYLLGPTPRYIFNEIGEFVVILYVWDGAELYDTDIIWINVSSPDLLILNPNYTEPTKISLNTQVQISCNVKNIGGIDTGTQTVVSYFNNTEPDEPFYEYILDPLDIDTESEQINAYWVSPTTPGTYYVTIEADHYNDIEELNENNNNHTIEFIVVDKPVTSHYIGEPSYVSDKIYVTSSTSISFSVVNNSGTGITSTKYKIGYGNEWTDITTSEHFNILDEGEHTVFYFSSDSIGGVEDIQKLELVVDNSAPQTTIGLGEPSYRAGNNDLWNISINTPINFTTIDLGLFPVGDLYIEYRIDIISGWNYFTSEFTLNGFSEDPHMIEYRAVDKLNNTEQTKRIFLKIDLTAPKTLIYFFEPVYEPDEIYITSETRFKFLETEIRYFEPGSGAQVCYYKIDDSPTFNIHRSYETFSGLTEGTHTIYYYSVDWIGNIEPENEVTVIVDNSAPETTIAPGDKFALTFTDNPKGNGSNSGVKTTLYQIDDGDWLDYAVTGKFSVPKGEHEISFYSIDNLNNTEQIKTLEVEIKDEDEDKLGVLVMVFALLAVLIIVFLVILMLIKRKRQKSEPYPPPPPPPESEVPEQMAPPEQVTSPEPEQYDEIPPPDLESQPQIETTTTQEPVTLPEQSPESEVDLSQNEDDSEREY
jgi:hypothetical protein